MLGASRPESNSPSAPKEMHGTKIARIRDSEGAEVSLSSGAYRPRRLPQRSIFAH